MGWYGRFNRAEYVAERLQGWTNGPHTITVRKHHAHGNEDWFILDVAGPDPCAVITLCLWDGTMVKHMDEAAGPYFYGCPVAWLDEVPAPATPYAWRARLRAHHVQPGSVPAYLTTEVR